MKHLLAVLALVLLVSVSGCIEPETSVRFSQLDGETAIAEEFSVSVDKIEPELQAVVTNQTKQNTTVRVSSSDEVIRHDGTYYAFERKQVGLTDVKRVEIATVEPSDKQATHDIKQLSEADTALIRASLEDPDNTRRFGAGKLYRGAEITESVLVEQGDVRVAYENTTYSVEVNALPTQTRQLYQYNAVVVSDTTSEYVVEIRDRSLHTIGSIDSRNTVLNQSVSTGSYYGEKTEDFETLNNSLPVKKALTVTEYAGKWLVRYDGQIYKASIKR